MLSAAKWPHGIVQAGEEGGENWVTLVCDTHRLSALRRRIRASAVKHRGFAQSVSIAESLVRDDADEGQESRYRVSDEHANAVLCAVVNERSGRLAETYVVEVRVCNARWRGIDAASVLLSLLERRRLTVRAMRSNGAVGTGFQLPRRQCQPISDVLSCIGSITEDAAEARSHESVGAASFLRGTTNAAAFAASYGKRIVVQRNSICANEFPTRGSSSRVLAFFTPI